MTTVAILYIVTAFLAILACIPQVMQLVKIKCSDEFELTTWSTWLMAQTVALVYVTSIGNTLLIITSSLWVTFYALMVALIIWYRPRNILRFKLRRMSAELTLRDKA